MKKRLLMLAPVAAVVVMALATASGQRTATPQPQQVPQQQLPPGTASLSGSVVVLGSGQAIPNASIELRRIDCNNFSNPPEVVTAKSDANGKFSFQNLHAGGWCIVATAAGGAYTPAEYMQRGTLGRGATIPIADGQKVSDIRLAMAPTGGIAGRIRDVDGEYLAHARVQVMEVFNEEGQRRLYILQVAQTNDRGEYRFFWLPPGPYYLAVVPENTRGKNVVSALPLPGSGGHREDVIAPVIVPRIDPNGNVSEEVYVTVYYPGERDVLRALPVEVQPGSITSGVDISLTAARSRSYHVRGTAKNTISGELAAGAQLRLAPKEWASTVIMPTATVDEKGNFDIAGVVPGSYVLIGNMLMPNPAAQQNPAGTPAQPAAGGAPPAPPIPLSGNIEIDVSGSSVENVQFSFVPGVVVPGRVVLEGVTAANPQRGLSVSLVREPDVVGLPSAQARGMIQADGTFNLQNVGPGEYRVYVPPLVAPFQWGTPNIPQALQNTYVKSIRLGNVDALTSRVRVTGGNSPGTIEVVIGQGGRLDGTTLNDRREPMPNVSVALIPDGVLRQRKDLFRSASSDLMGRFRMQGIPPGPYKVYAFEEISSDAWQNPDFMRPLESRGAAVDIRDGSQASVDLQAIPKTRR